MFKILKEHKHFGKQILLLSKNELIKTYKGAFLGYGWAIIKPVFTLLALWFLFALGLRGSSTRHGDMIGIFPFLLTGYVPWFFINDSMLHGTKCIRSHSQFVTKISYPVSTIMTFTNLSKLYVSVALTGIMYVVLICLGYQPDITNVQFFLYCPLMFLFFLGLSWVNAPLAVFSRDFENLINSILTMLFWISGSLFDTYSLDNAVLRRIMYFNPITFFVNGYRKTFLYNEWFWEHSKEINKGVETVYYSSAWENYIFLGELVLVLILGSIIYKKTRKTIADIL